MVKNVNSPFSPFTIGISGIHEDLSKGIYSTEKYLIQFLSNLLLKGNYTLKNREMHILFDTVNDTVKPQIDTVNDTVFSLIEKNKQITTKELSEKLGVSLSTVKRKINSLKQSGVLE
jgi:predicted HTH transcriptional regulator